MESNDITDTLQQWLKDLLIHGKAVVLYEEDDDGKKTVRNVPLEEVMEDASR